MPFYECHDYPGIKTHGLINVHQQCVLGRGEQMDQKQMRFRGTNDEDCESGGGEKILTPVAASSPQQGPKQDDHDTAEKTVKIYYHSSPAALIPKSTMVTAVRTRSDHSWLRMVSAPMQPDAL